MYQLYLRNYLIQFVEILRRYDLVAIEIKNMIEKVSEFVLLEVCQVISTGLNSQNFCNIITKTTMYPCS